MSSERNINDELLFRYLSGTVTTEERTAIELWLAEESHPHQLEEVRMMWAAANVQRPAEVNAEAAWLQLKQKINQGNKDRRIISWKTVWSSAAAVILLIFGAYVLQQFFVKSSTSPTADKPFATIEQASTQSASIADKAKTTQQQPRQTVALDVPPAEVRTTKEAIGKASTSGSSQGEPLATAEKKNEEICNNTQCPLEICIVQSLPCDGSKETTFAHCSLLQPDASGLLHYKEYNDIDCRARVKEIRISKTNTGETIVLNETSSPVTAQEFFDYMTGYKTGNIVAGNFESDCDNPCMEQSINLDNRFGTPVLH